MIIDIHTHYYPRRYLDRLAERTEIPRLDRQRDGEHFVIFADEEKVAGSTRPIGDGYFRLERKLEFMDQHGIDASLVSIGNPWVDFMDVEEAASWATLLNEEVEAVCAKEERFHGVGVVPLQGVDAACAELARISRLPNIHGVVIGTRPGNRHLDDPELHPFWACAEEQGIPLFIHPHYTVGADWMAGYGHAMLLALGFTFETTVAVTRLILGGVLERHPGLRIILAHAGGTLPYLAGRLDGCTRVDVDSSGNLSKPFSEYLRMMYYDAVAYHASALYCALDLVGPGRLLFGTDHPFGIADPQACREAIHGAAATEEDARAILGGNAQAWLTSSLL